MSGLNLKKTEDAPKVESTQAATVVARWSSHPIMRYRVGEFQFDDGLLEITDPESAKEFDAILESLPLSEQCRIKKVDLAAAEALAKQAIAASGQTTQGIDSATGDRDPAKPVGQGDLAAGL